MNLRRYVGSLALIGLCLFSTNAAGTLDTDSQDPNQWVLPLGSYSAIRHSKLNQITPANVSRLKVSWMMSTGTLRGQEGQPLVVGDMMYFESSYPNFVYAVNLDNVGKIVWKFSPEHDKFAPSVSCCDVLNRVVTYSAGNTVTYAVDTKID